MEKLHRSQTPGERKHIDQLLEIDLAIWTATQNLNLVLNGEIPMKTKKANAKRKELKAMANPTFDAAITLLTSTVADSIAASERVIAVLQAGTTTPAQVQAITDATNALTTETAKIVAANV